ncbi:hypothetical protein [Georgenia thermotolerans]|uniref:Uncharacterized protein n=1 Tax=Georgenia thermotolerans TaxID=527326 RepID=A0A7J5UR13_9MICO|nr:hypothetical protein [Georgenia thermotolerans]KAE8764333.1 hypothetical protein GB883_09645 [Georgenia thermotolerans]
MAWWEYLIVLGVVLLAQFVGGFALAAWRDRSARRAPARIRAGRRVPVAVTVLADGPRRCLAVRDGEDVRIHGRKIALVVSTTEAAAATVRRDHIDEEMAELAELRGFVDEHGRQVFLGPPEEWAPAYAALIQAPAARAGRLTLLWSASLRPATVAGALAVLAASLVQAIWWSGLTERLPGVAAP